MVPNVGLDESMTTKRKKYLILLSKDIIPIRYDTDSIPCVSESEIGGDQENREERTSQLARFRSKAFYQNPRLLCSRDTSAIPRCQRKRRNNLTPSRVGEYRFGRDFE
ncbi:hypothetical protein TNCV_162051 [Trichonephila clavipes]|nr:hypothetical protein TNCV_162051 [Trichonephila clavipes]